MASSVASMRVIGATFQSVEAAEAARGDLELTLALAPGTFRWAFLGDRGEPDDGRPLLAGSVGDASAPRVLEIVARHGGSVVADVRGV
jgi:hypothetical protein